MSRYRVTILIGALAVLCHAQSAIAAADAAVLAAAEACEPYARALLQRLVSIDSGTANVAGLDDLSSTLLPELERLGATVQRVPSTVPGLADSLLATWTGTGRGRILLIAHMDTVFLPGVAAERPYRVDGNRGIGPGAGDDKQGIVTGLCALRALREIGFRDYGRIALILNSNEETGSTGSRELIRAEAAASDVALNLERGVPPDGVVVARKGSAKMNIEITGRAAHSGLEPEQGRNAVVEAAHQILAMGEAREDHRGDVGKDERQGDVGDDFMRLFQLLASRLADDPGEGAGLLIAAIDHEPGDDRRGKKDEQ